MNVFYQDEKTFIDSIILKKIQYTLWKLMNFSKVYIIYNLKKNSKIFACIGDLINTKIINNSLIIFIANK